MSDYIKREEARRILTDFINVSKNPVTLNNVVDLLSKIHCLPAADVREEENILKFYYVRSIDEYWIGQRVGNFYYAEYNKGQWVWTHSRYLPWGEHVTSPDTLWKEHTYPSEPEELPFSEWLTGFIKKHAIAEPPEEVEE